MQHKKRHHTNEEDISFPAEPPNKKYKIKPDVYPDETEIEIAGTLTAKPSSPTFILPNQNFISSRERKNSPEQHFQTSNLSQMQGIPDHFLLRKELPSKGKKYMEQ